MITNSGYFEHYDPYMDGTVVPVASGGNYVTANGYQMMTPNQPTYFASNDQLVFQNSYHHGFPEEQVSYVQHVPSNQHLLPMRQPQTMQIAHMRHHVSQPNIYYHNPVMNHNTSYMPQHNATVLPPIVQRRVPTARIVTTHRPTPTIMAAPEHTPVRVIRTPAPQYVQTVATPRQSATYLPAINHNANHYFY